MPEPPGTRIRCAKCGKRRPLRIEVEDFRIEQAGGWRREPGSYVEAMRPLIEVMVRIAPDILAVEAGRRTPDIWEAEVLEGLGDALPDAMIARFGEDDANVEGAARLLEHLGREAGLEVLALARAVGLASETLQLADVRLRALAGGA